MMNDNSSEGGVCGKEVERGTSEVGSSGGKFRTPFGNIICGNMCA